MIKVGKVGPNSNNRFRYQHYSSGSANSTLAAAIENNPVLWGYIGFPGNTVNSGDWLREHTDRNNFYFSDFAICKVFEVYARAKLGSIYEGSLSGGANTGSTGHLRLPLSQTVSRFIIGEEYK